MLVIVVTSDKFLVLISRTALFQGYGAKEIRRYLRTGDPAALGYALDVLGFSVSTTRGSRGRARLFCAS